MAEAARAKNLLRNVGEQNLEMADLREPVQPFPIDAIWAEFRNYLSNKDWARIAGTCKASWDLQLQHIYLTPNTPVAGELR